MERSKRLQMTGFAVFFLSGICAISSGVIPIRCTELYVHGDLIMEEDAFLEADAVYVSGQITGNDRISGSVVQEAYTSGLDYHVQVVERLM